MTDEDVSKPEEVITVEKAVEPPPPPAPRRSGLLGGLIGGVLAAGAGFGVAQFVPQGWPLADTAALEAQLTAQTGEIAALKAQLAELSARPVPASDAGLEGRMAALEAKAGEPVPAPDLAPLSDRIAQVESRLTGIESLPADGSAASPAAIAAQAQALAALQAEVQALKAGGGMSAELAALSQETEKKLAEAVASAEVIKAEAAALIAGAEARTALGQVLAAMDSGAPYATLLPALGDVPEALTAQAASGVPTLPALREEFPAAARAALEAALQADMGATWSERIGSFLKTQTGARSLTPREGGDPDAILSRAEAALQAGDLAAALAEVQALPEAGKTAIQPWVARAEARQAALAAMAEVSARIGG